MANFLDDSGLSHLWDRLSTFLAGKQNTLTFDSAPTAGSTNPVTSGGIRTALNDVSPTTLNITLSSSSWSNNSQTVSVSDMTTTALVFSTPGSASAEKYAECGVKLTSQANGSLTFTCETVPNTNLTVQIAYWLI